MQKSLVETTFIFTLSLALCASPSADAQSLPASQPSVENTVIRQAKALYNKAQVQYRLGKFETALTLYEAALKLVERPSVIFNIAQCYNRLDQYKKAIFHYRHYLAVWKKTHAGQAAPDAAAVEALIAEMTIKRIKSDGKTSKPQQVIVKPSTTVVIKRDDSFKRAAPAGLIRIGGLTVEGARVMVDGILKGVAPITHLISVKPGIHRVAVVAKGYQPWRREFNIPADRETLLPVRLERLPERSSGWLTATIGAWILAAGAEAMAIYFTVKANEHIRQTVAFDDDKKMVMLGHGLAGGLAALSAIPLYFYIVSNKVEMPSGGSALIAPTRGGAMALGTFHF